MISRSTINQSIASVIEINKCEGIFPFNSSCFGASSQLPLYSALRLALFKFPFIIMGKGWIRTPEQEEYLEGEFQSYLKARNDSEVKNWHAKLHDKWEDCWPERQVLINEWKLPDNTPFNTAQMESLGKLWLHGRR